MTRLILFLIRLKLGVKKYEQFTFTNQKEKNCHYYFDNWRLTKVIDKGTYISVRDSRVSLNWLLSPECKVNKNITELMI